MANGFLKCRLKMITVRVFHKNITNKSVDDTNEEVFMTDRCIPSAHIFLHLICGSHRLFANTE